MPCRAVLVVVLASLAAGCITVDGAPVQVQILLTQERGTVPLLDETITVPGNGSALDALQEVAQVELRYGGGFVHAVDGIESDAQARVDWFYEVDGVQAGIGAADWHLQGGEVVHWDHRHWETPGVPPGLWNSFPWQDAAHHWQPDLAHDTAPLAADWPERWPDGAVVAHVAPDRAPWDDIYGATMDGDALVVGDTRLSPPWSLAVRMGPPDTAHAVVVHQDHTPEPPSTGYGWAFAPDGPVEVVP